MGTRRVVYQEWIVALGRDPARTWEEVAPGDTGDRLLLIEAVDRVLATLPEAEEDFIRRFHFMGQTYPEISRATGRTIHKLERLHRRILRKLAFRLRRYAGNTALPATLRETDCPLCKHPRRVEINALIESKKKEETWRRIIHRLRHQYGLVKISPQRLIGHVTYHMAPDRTRPTHSKDCGETIA